jgi:branched-chain amino acid transport system permease protein
MRPGLKALLLGAGVIVLFLLPTGLGNQRYLVHLLILVCLYAIPAVGLNLMLGFTGLLSLGHAAFAGIGAYTCAVLTVDYGVSFWLALLAATLVSGVAGLLVGVPSLRLRGHYFIIVTLAFGMILYAIMNNWDSVTRGAEGFVGIPRPPTLRLGALVWDFSSLTGFYYLALVLALLVFALQALLVRSDFGRALMAIRQDEILANAKGVNTRAYKLAVFAIGSAIAGLGGALFGSFLRVVSPLSFDLLESINYVLIVVLGGAGYLSSPLWGGVLFVGFPEYLRMAREWRLVIFGLLLVLLTLFARRGVAGLIHGALARRKE